MQHTLGRLTNPDRTYSRAELLGRSSLAPKAPGIYGWYFTPVPADVPTPSCVVSDRRRVEPDALPAKMLLQQRALTVSCWPSLEHTD